MLKKLWRFLNRYSLGRNESVRDAYRMNPIEVEEMRAWSRKLGSRNPFLQSDYDELVKEGFFKNLSLKKKLANIVLQKPPQRLRWLNMEQTRFIGLSIGGALAVTISWSLNHAILWAVLHGIFGWFYVLYYALCLR